MKFYGFPLSPFVRKVVVAVKEKGLEAEVVPSNPSQPDEEFAAISPFHKIPAFRDGDFTLADSTAIVTYLDAKYPEPALLPASPEARAKAIDAEEAVKRPLAYLDGAVSDGWLAGEFTVGDIAVASVIRTLGYAGWQLDEAAYPRLAAWYGRVQAREGWKQAAEVENAMIAAAGF